MKKNLLLLSLLSIFLQVGILESSFAEGYKRIADFEWEPVEGAKKYEIEVVKKKQDDEKKYQLQTSEPKWKGKLSPGTYLVKVRGLDLRGVPGEWSEPQELQVHLETVEFIKPNSNEFIQSKSDQSDKINFSWRAVPGAKSYHLIILDSNGQKITETNLSETQFSTSLPVAKKYSARIHAEDTFGVTSEATTELEFSLIGKKLTSPKIQKPKNEFVREIKWSAPQFTEAYDFEMQNYDPKTKTWKLFQHEKIMGNNFKFPADWPGGHYRLKLKSQAPLRTDSDLAQINFKVHKGDRSPASEFTSMVRQSINRVERWYGLVSYMITQISYSSIYTDTAGSTSYETLGGALRLGLGYEGVRSPWGFLGIVDYSGFQNDSGQYLTYPAIETSLVYKKTFKVRDEARFHMGLFMKELPATLANGQTQTVSDDRISSIGPHLGAEYWYAMTPKWGAQANAHLYYNMAKLASPNGEAIQPSVSMSLGAMASYRANEVLTYLIGITRREEKIRYGQGSTICSTTGCSGDNSVEVKGIYLNFYGEYNF